MAQDKAENRNAVSEHASLLTALGTAGAERSVLLLF